jgi:hypothetical protein
MFRKVCAPSVPFWDAERRQLWLGNKLIREFRQAARNQVALLDALHKCGWVVRRIDNPLSNDPAESPKERNQRLQDTVKNLNRGLVKGTIRFHMDCDGLGVRWDYCSRHVESDRSCPDA